jgi:predicted ATP-dependent endonuclease of OLD family
MARKTPNPDIQLFGKPYLVDLFDKAIDKAIDKVIGLLKNDKDESKPTKLSYLNFRIQNFKGIKDVEIDLVKNNLVLLLGLNESGKTTILKAIECFNFLNDPEQVFNPKFFHSIRKKADVNSNDTALVTALIKIHDNIELKKVKSLEKMNLTEKDIENINSFIYDLNEKKEVMISRVFPFKQGKP